MPLWVDAPPDRPANLWCPDIYPKRRGELLLVSPQSLQMNREAGMKVHIIYNRERQPGESPCKRCPTTVRVGPCVYHFIQPRGQKWD